MGTSTPFNTEPIVRIYAEGPSLESAHAFAKRIKDQIVASFGVILLVLWAFVGLSCTPKDQSGFTAGSSVYSSKKVTNYPLQTQLPTRPSRIFNQ